MLLRLLPAPTPSTPAPPTILFTLPLPTHPYSSRNLPLPPNLHAHRAVCIQEDVECSNVLLGEKSSWIGGIIDDVTFSLPSKSVVVNFIDGSELNLPIDDACIGYLDRVVNEVHLSFAPPAPQPAPVTPQSVPMAPRRSTSSILYSIFSPLIPGATDNRASLPSNPQPPARAHRRQARSILVDTYRRFVLPMLRDRLPDSYISWAISSETHMRMAQFDELRTEINEVLATSKVDLLSIMANMARPRASSSSSYSSASDASELELELESMPITPATSVFSTSACSTPASPCNTAALSPQTFLLSIPPAHVVPLSHRNVYSAQLARLTAIASRLAAIKKLQTRYEREEGKRKWLEVLERGRLGDKSLRRAFSAGQIRASTLVNADPIKRTTLWRSFSAADMAAQHEYAHPAMADDMHGENDSPFDSEEEDSASESESDDEFPITPRGSLTVSTPMHFGVLDAPRPILQHRPDAEQDMSSLFDSVLSQDSEEDEEELREATRIGLRWTVQAQAKATVITPRSKFDEVFADVNSDWDDSPQSVRVEVYNQY